MPEIFDIKKYKDSLAILPHLDSILKILDLTDRSLCYFRSYIPVAKILIVIKEQKAVLETYRTAYKKVKDSKGKK